MIGGDAIDKVTTINGLHGVQIYKIEPYCTVKKSYITFYLKIMHLFESSTGGNSEALG